MFIHLKLKSLKGLQECRLENLGRLNVISGKNNSGKTTVLEAFNSSENRSSGFDASPTAVAAFIDEFRKLPGWEDIAPSTKFDPDLTQALEEALLHRPVWYDDEQQELVNEIRNRLRASDLGERDFDSATISKLVEGIFPVGSTLLIPASRTLQLVRPLRMTDGSRPFTEDFVNRLTHLKTQPLGSHLYVLFEMLCRAFEYVSSGHKLDIQSDANSNVVELVFSQPIGSRDIWRPARDCGLGLQDLAVILYHAIVESADTILLEEPESHMHPALQKRLVRFLLDETSKQYVISTHSNVFLDTTTADQVFLCEYRDQVTVRNATGKAAVLTDLGYEVADNLVSDLVVLVEGPSDAAILRTLLAKMDSPQDKLIKFWYLCGDAMTQVDLSVVQEGYSVVALVDKDPERERGVWSCNATLGSSTPIWRSVGAHTTTPQGTACKELGSGRYFRILKESRGPVLQFCTPIRRESGDACHDSSRNSLKWTPCLANLQEYEDPLAHRAAVRIHSGSEVAWMRIEIGREEDGRWIAEVPDLPGVMVYGKTREQAISKAEALALRVIADRLDHGESVPELDELFAVPA